jgi:hypothetical protein
MGITVESYYNEHFKCTLPNAYIAFSSQTVRINGSEVSATYGIWYDHASRLADGGPLALDVLTFTTDGSDIWNGAYSILKQQFPNAIDC